MRRMKERQRKEWINFAWNVNTDMYRRMMELSIKADKEDVRCSTNNTDRSVYTSLMGQISALKGTIKANLQNIKNVDSGYDLGLDYPIYFQIKVARIGARTIFDEPDPHPHLYNLMDADVEIKDVDFDGEEIEGEDQNEMSGQEDDGDTTGGDDDFDPED